MARQTASNPASSVQANRLLVDKLARVHTRARFAQNLSRERERASEQHGDANVYEGGSSTNKHLWSIFVGRHVAYIVRAATMRAPDDERRVNKPPAHKFFNRRKPIARCVYHMSTIERFVF